MFCVPSHVLIFYYSWSEAGRLNTGSLICVKILTAGFEHFIFYRFFHAKVD